MITKELVDKINTLARKQRAEGLTPEEKEEQARLRQEYLKGIRGQVEQSLSQIKFVEDQPGCGCGCEGHSKEKENKKHSDGCGCGSTHKPKANKTGGCGCGGNHKGIYH